MSRETNAMRPLVRQQLDRRLNQIREVMPALAPPRGGWVASLRSALGMSQATFARRMRVTQQTVSQLEKREAEGTVTLAAMQKAATALGARLVYAIVPDQPLGEVLEQRALRIAQQQASTVRHTMRLEDQEPDADLDVRAKELAEELLTDPRKLW